LDALTAAAAFLTDDDEDDPAGADCVSHDGMVALVNTDLAAALFSDSDISLPRLARTPDVPVIAEVVPLISSALEADGNNMDLGPAGQQTPVRFQASHSELASLFLEGDESDDDTDNDSSSPSNNARMSDHGVNQAAPTPAGGLGSLPLLVNHPTSMTDLVALFDSEGEDKGSDEQEVQSSNNASNTAAAGPYTAQSFGHIPDEWLGDL